MAEAGYRGGFLWYDLMTTDPAAAAAFYTRVVGWGTAPYETPGLPPYTMWMAGERPIGGVAKLPDDAPNVPPHWLSYIGTPDVDATAAQAERLGGRVVMPAMDVATIGRVAVLHDPQGATFGIYRPEGDAPGTDKPGIGDISWHELATTDYQASFGFYAELFGWVETGSMDMGEQGAYLMFGRPGGIPLGGIYNKSPDQPGPAWLYYATVADVSRVAEDTKRNGGKVIAGPMEVPGGDHIVMCLDPQGAGFGAHQAKR